ncbi:uncharacterized protein LOC122425377 [Cervus canadensis]|uniref:uncharacterized protein LOC122425377 n=1 Tax=Cervus canadensis TaxID=1574408 RepID=UPI001CA30BAB|nr:uncharacterized protein LOC122425377 [Cervus canadensis]
MSSLGARSPPQPLRTARGVRTAPDRAAAPLGGRAGRAAVETPCVLRASRLQAALRLGTHEHRREGAGPAGSLSNGAWPGSPRRPGREGRERRPLRACPPSRRWAPRAPASSGRRGASGPPRKEEAAAGLVVFALKCGCSRPAGGGGVRSLGSRPTRQMLSGSDPFKSWQQSEAETEGTCWKEVVWLACFRGGLTWPSPTSIVHLPGGNAAAGPETRLLPGTTEKPVDDHSRMCADWWCADLPDVRVLS